MAALGLIATLCAAGPAVADPTNQGLPVTLSCDNGETYAAVFRGGADWNVFLDTGSSAVFVPTLQQFNGTLTDPAGTLSSRRATPTADRERRSTAHSSSRTCATMGTPSPRGVTSAGS